MGADLDPRGWLGPRGSDTWLSLPALLDRGGHHQRITVSPESHANQPGRRACTCSIVERPSSPAQGVRPNGLSQDHSAWLQQRCERGVSRHRGAPSRQWRDRRVAMAQTIISLA